MEYRRISDANEITARYMDSILIKEKLIDSVVADGTVRRDLFDAGDDARIFPSAEV